MFELFILTSNERYIEAGENLTTTQVIFISKVQVKEELCVLKGLQVFRVRASSKQDTCKPACQAVTMSM